MFYGVPMDPSPALAISMFPLYPSCLPALDSTVVDPRYHLISTQRVS